MSWNCSACHSCRRVYGRVTVQTYPRPKETPVIWFGLSLIILGIILMCWPDSHCCEVSND